MPAESPIKAKTCASCGHEHEDQFRFCLSCGQSVGDADGKVAPAEIGTKCPNCSKVEVLNDKFCINCGLGLKEESAAEKATRRTNLRPTQLRAQQTTLLFSPENSRGPSRAASNLLTAIAGIVCGIVAAGFLYESKFLDYALMRLSWPHSGVVVYAMPSYFQAKLESLDANSSLIAKSNARGALAVSDVPPGAYRVTLGSPGYRTIVQTIRVNAKGPTVFGFPEQINLPKENSTSL